MMRLSRILVFSRNILKSKKYNFYTSLIQKVTIRNGALVPMTTKFVINRCDPDYNKRYFTNTSPAQEELVESSIYEKVCEETLDSLSEYFEEIVEIASHLKSADVSYGVRFIKIHTYLLCDS